MRSCRRSSLVFALVLAGCATTAPRPESVPSLPAGLVLHALDGSSVHLDDLRGKPILLDVFASWCDPCRASMPFYADLAQRYGPSGLEVLPVSVDEDDRALARFVERAQLPLTFRHDASGAIAEALQVKVMPTLFLVDRTGRVRLRHESFRETDRETLENAVKELVR